MPRYEEGKGPPPAEEKGYVTIPWTLEECLPPFASYKLPQIPMSVDEAQILMSEFEGLPKWAKELAPIEQAREMLKD